MKVTEGHNYCIDPLKKHKKKISQNLRPVTKGLSDLIQEKIKCNQLICDVCRKFIQKDPIKCLSALPVEEALKDDYDLKTTSSSSSASSIFVEKEKLVNVKKILDLSGVTPVKKEN
ncbi:hypothetical protein Avbf_15849 [Armadillidium vulgare]|nr:hypothetical protein Avbf_15849 [Armadillidium vulgare]